MARTLSSISLICLVISQVALAELHHVLKFESSSCWTPQCPDTLPVNKMPRLIPDPNNCRKAFVCTNGVARQYYCPEGLIFDASRQECVQQSGCKRGIEIVQLL